MSCNTCQTKFSFFTKENACPNCGFSYCSRCLKYRCNLPSTGKGKICGRCYNKLKTSEQCAPETPDLGGLDELAPVDVAMKVQNLENPTKPPIVVYKHTSHWDQFKKGLDPADQEIVDRLRKLKGEDANVSPPSVEELMRRLALLRDQDPDTVNKKANIYQVDTRTEQQKANDLMQEYIAQLQLSSETADPCSEIEERLRMLRGDIAEKNRAEWKNTDDDYDEDAVTKKMIKKALAEAALEKQYSDVDELEDVECEATQVSDDEDEKPSCVMCERTTNLSQCFGSTGDLYCPTCFEDNYDDFEIEKLKRVPFNSKSQVSPD